MEIEIEDYDVELIMLDRYKDLNILLENSYCVTCRDMTTIINYKPYLNRLNDILLKGFCIKCNGSVGRYIETGENIESTAVAIHIKNVLKMSKKKKK